MPKANDMTIHSDNRFSELFESKVPRFVKRFECADKDKMAKYWPAGTDAAMQVLNHMKLRFAF